ncbi:NUDIX hydrolase [Phycicoccus duodecadis]|uniref:ADP-ribose pyrophosphatase YjhB (NUDIX family) n=1 Tax=Phycicoccus duodecadis TaxID=173053 RepID=A0A2N3YKI6_9MICO|nr:NUDIX domain-containing protein [Phycicoccus duodecadis]PKW27373.1 ADP-ribose pyrophosphatase YjhB (NUDIX family) [Phycicoccus duodecadis]
MITVVGLVGGEEVVRFVLAHGEDPHDGLRARGWSAGEVQAHGALGRLVLEFAVHPVVAPGGAAPGRPHGPGLTDTERRGVTPRQRVAAYAVVVADGSLLLTQLSSATGAGGRWNLPGGGVDEGETPAAAVVREVAEETGQVVVDVRLREVMTQHWVGHSPRGAEDYHAVRLLHTARCPEPTPAVVHDVGGSTSAARWVPWAELGAMPVVASVPRAVRAAGLPWDHPWPQS